MKLRFLSSFLLLLVCMNAATAQTVIPKFGIQDSLSRLCSKIYIQKTDSACLISNHIFFNAFQQVLETQPSSGLSLDSIQGVTKVATADNKFRIFTWNVPMQNGTNKYFGFIQFAGESPKIIPLISCGKDQNDLEAKQLTVENWYGAIYYKLIEQKKDDLKAFTLLGWDGYSAGSNRKFIDIISVDKTGAISFGEPIFKTDQGIKNRIIKEYSRTSSMLLRYDYQSIMVKKNNNKIKKVDSWIIVMDRLVPLDPSLKGIPKYYVPSGEIYDGYVFRDGFWVLAEDIEVVNR